ncbi:MAG: MEDS domain-containing protein [Bauldia sp.]
MSVGPTGAEPRLTGIEILGEARWGTHLCALFGTKTDLLEICAAYFAAGLAANEACVWALPQQVSAAEAIDALGGADVIGSAIDRGGFEFVTGRDWYLRGDEDDSLRISGAWQQKLDAALDRGFEGLRISGHAYWMRGHHWQDLAGYEAELDRSFAGRRMLTLCTYAIGEARAADVFDLARAHQYALGRRRGEWELLGTPELRTGRYTQGPSIDIMTKPFPAERRLTPRERVVLKEIVRGASSKEAARILGISPRTIEFHRSNIMTKLGVRTTVDLVRTVLSEEG